MPDLSLSRHRPLVRSDFQPYKIPSRLLNCPQPSHHPIPPSDPASLPFALAPLESILGVVPFGVRRSGAAIFQPISLRASIDSIHESDPAHYAVARTRRLKRECSGGFLPGHILKPHSLLPPEACLLSKPHILSWSANLSGAPTRSLAVSERPRSSSRFPSGLETWSCPSLSRTTVSLPWPRPTGLVSPSALSG